MLHFVFPMNRPFEIFYPVLDANRVPPGVIGGPYAETKEQLGGVAINKFTDIDRALEAWLKHPCLRVGDVLEIRPADEEFNARIAARDALVARH